MADDPERDLYPTKEVRDSLAANTPHAPDRLISTERGFHHHPLSKSDLEDEFYKFKEENLQLKKATRKQEDELKRLSTKLTRLLREKKSIELKSSPGHKRDLELEEMVDDLQGKVRQLERTNTHLRERILVAKQQVITQSKRPSPYRHVPPKVNSGINRSGNSPYLASSNLRSKNLQNLLGKSGMPPIPSFALNLLEEARAELSNQTMLVHNQKTEIEMYQEENDIMKQKMRMREIEFEEELNNMKSELSQKQRQHVEENLDLIRLHRELKQKNSNILAIQTQYNDMEQKFRILKLNHDHLMKDIEDLAMRFKNEQKRNIDLCSEIQKSEINMAATSEMQEKIKSLLKENEVLRDTNDKLINNALAIEKERSFSQVEQLFKEKISNLESTLDLQSKSKSTLEEELSKLKGNLLSKEEECHLLKEQDTQMKSHITQLEMKIESLISEKVNTEDLQRAIESLKLKEAEINKNTIEVSNNKIGNEIPVMENEDLKNKSNEIDALKIKLKECERVLNESLEELNSIKEMLAAQTNLNEALQSEVQALTNKLEEKDKESNIKLEEYSHLLDIRASRIQKLEKQLNDIAYGTKTFSIPQSDTKHEDAVPAKLGQGDNVLEIQIIKFNFTAEGLKRISAPSSNIFLTWNFYEFELQSTPIASAERPVFGFTSLYTVQVDDYFLYYLKENLITMELHESLGITSQLIASCKISLKDLLSKNSIDRHQEMLGVKNFMGVNIGNIEICMKFKTPLRESYKKFQEKIKALQYIHNNQEISTSAISYLENVNSANNDLHIKIIRGMNLVLDQVEKQPSTFCAYKFFDTWDHITNTIPSSNNPEFYDHQTFSVEIDSHLDAYLKNKSLKIFVFDFNEPDLSSYIGQTSIPLSLLSQNQSIKGIFNLSKGKQHSVGSLEILIYWQSNYDLTHEKDISQKSPTRRISHDSASSLSSDEDARPKKVFSPDVGDSVLSPPVPKPRKIPPAQTTPPSEIKSSSPSISSGEDSLLSSPKVSPISYGKDRRIVPIPAQRKSKTESDLTENSSPQILERKPDYAQYDDNDALLDNLPSIERRISFDNSSDSEKKRLASVESSESEGDDYSLYQQRKPVDEVASITILVSHLTLKEDAAILQNPAIKLLYVEYRFLDYPLEELETPFSLPKSAAPSKLEFNFKKVLPLRTNDAEKWNLLLQMFTSDSPDASLIKFTVVSEPPPDDEDFECEDIGYGYFDLGEILHNQEEKSEGEILIYDAEDATTVIGSLNISIKALDALMLLDRFATFS